LRDNVLFRLMPPIFVESVCLKNFTVGIDAYVAH
jgi:hypothetical protein